MGIFDWFRRKGRPVQRHAVVRFDDVQVTCCHPDGAVQTVLWAELRVVRIRTNSLGPYVEDVFWELEDANGVCEIPNGTPSLGPLIERLSALPGFDQDAFSGAMSSTADAEFTCWRRKEG